MALRHSHEFVARHASHFLNVVHLQYQQYNDVLIEKINVRVNATKKINTSTAL